MTGARNHRRRYRGFTLVELMVVLAIIAVLAAVGVSRMAKRSSYTATAGLAREVYALCNQARITALASRKQAWIRFGPTNPVAQLRVATVAGSGVIPAAQWGPVEASVNGLGLSRLTGVDPGALLNGMAPAAQRTASIDVIFYPSGTVQVVGSGTTGATVYMADSNMNFPQRVVLYGRTGFAKVVDR